MHLPRNRLGSCLIAVEISPSGSDEFSVLGGAVARVSGPRIPIIEGLDREPTLEEMTAFCAAFAAISPLPMMHIVGITPEAPSRADALAPGATPEPLRLDELALSAERRRYSTANQPGLHAVAVGCPHASLAQVMEIASILGERKIAAGIRFLVQVDTDCADRAEAGGLARRLAAAGVTLQADSCIHIAYDQIPAGRTLATNSLKLAYLTASHDVKVHLAPCINASTRRHPDAGPTNNPADCYKSRV